MRRWPPRSSCRRRWRRHRSRRSIIRALMEGLGTREDIDQGAKLGLHHPMGPLELADFVGLDTHLYICGVLYEGLHDARFAAPPLLRQLVDAGHFGRKTGRGFYRYGSDGSRLAD